MVFCSLISAAYLALMKRHWTRFVRRLEELWLRSEPNYQSAIRNTFGFRTTMWNSFWRSIFGRLLRALNIFAKDQYRTPPSSLTITSSLSPVTCAPPDHFLPDFLMPCCPVFKGPPLPFCCAMSSFSLFLSKRELVMNKSGQTRFLSSSGKNALSFRVC